MTPPIRVPWRTFLAGLAVVCALVVWLTRYDYVEHGRTILRVNRWTGHADMLVGSAWRAVLTELPSAGADPLDSLARSRGLKLP